MRNYKILPKINSFHSKNMGYFYLFRNQSTNYISNNFLTSKYNFSSKSLFQNNFLKKAYSFQKIPPKFTLKNIIFNSKKHTIRQKIFRDDLCQYSQELSTLKTKRIKLIKFNKIKEKYDKNKINSDNDIKKFQIIKDDYDERRKFTINKLDLAYKNKLNNSLIGILNKLMKKK